MSFFAWPWVLNFAISRMVSTDSCLALSMKLQVLTTRISASSGRAVRRAPARSSRPIITSESTRFLGQPREIKPTLGPATGSAVVPADVAAGAEISAVLLTHSIVPGVELRHYGFGFCRFFNGPFEFCGEQDLLIV